MKAIIPLVALAMQLATAQTPDSVSAAPIPVAPSISVDTSAAAPVAPALPEIVSAPAPVVTPLPSVVSATPLLVQAAPAPEPKPVAASNRAGIVEREGKWQLGFGAGMASGYGLSVRRWFGEHDAVQLNLAPYVSRTNYPEEDEIAPEGMPHDSGFILDASVSVGLTWFHEIYQHQVDPIRQFTLLSYVAGSAFIGVEQQQMDRWKPSLSEPSKPIRYYDDYKNDERTFRLGSGVAGEFSVWRLSATLGLGLGGWYETESENFGISGDVQVGTHFRF